MFVAALNSDRPAQTQNVSAPAGGSVRTAARLPGELTTRQIEALVARHWLEFPLARGWKQSAA